jgi:hypothetical protein
VHLFETSDPGAMFGERGSIGLLFETHLPTLLDAHGPLAVETFGALVSPELAELETEVLNFIGELTAAAERDGTALDFASAFAAIADGIVGIEYAVATGELRGLISTVWAVNMAAQCSVQLALRERSEALFAFARQVRESKAAFDADPMTDASLTLAKHLLAKMLEANHRVAYPMVGS